MQFEQRGSDCIGDNHPQMLAFPELGAASHHHLGTLLEGTRRGRLPVREFHSLAVRDEYAIMQMKEISGDSSSLEAGAHCLSGTDNPSLVGDLITIYAN